MRINVLEDFRHEGVLYAAEEKNRRIDDAAGRAYCEAGLAEDAAGAVPTGTRDPHKRVRIEPDNTAIEG